MSPVIHHFSLRDHLHDRVDHGAERVGRDRFADRAVLLGPAGDARLEEVVQAGQLHRSTASNFEELFEIVDIECRGEIAKDRQALRKSRRINS